MIDWLEYRVPLASARTLETGCVLSVSPDGLVEWQTAKWLKARGSHDETTSVRPLGDELHISGCPAKFLQGHNIFGSDDLRGLLVDSFLRLVEVLGLAVTDDEFAAVKEGRVELLRVDVNYSYATGSRANALAWIRGAEQFGYLAHRGRGMLTGSTVSWGRGSRYFSIKAYSKGEEIAVPKHRLPSELRGLGLEEWADDKLRLELQIRARSLRGAGLGMASVWRDETPKGIFGEHLGKLNISGECRVNGKKLMQVPQPVRMTYLAWKAGEDVRKLLTKPTFYRHRKALLCFGVDIASRSPDGRANVIPLRRVIEAVPVDVPEWAVGTPLYFEPRRIA